MADNQFQGLFSQFGVDPRTKEELLAEQRRARFEAARDRTQALAPRFKSAAETAMYNIGATAGAALGQNKYLSNKPKLDEATARRAEAVQNVNAVMKDQIGTQAWADMEPEAKQDFMQRTLAAELAKAGDVQTGVSIFANLAQKERMRKAQALELRKLETGADTADLKLEAGQFDLFQKRLGQLTNVYKVGETQPMSAYIDPETKAAKMADGTEIPVGDYAFDPDPAALAGARGQRGGSGRQLVTNSEAAGYRKQRTAVIRQMDAAVKMKRALMDAAAAGDGTINILGGAGKGLSFVSRIVDGLSAVGRVMEQDWIDKGKQVQPVAIKDGDFAGRDLTNKGSAAEYAQANRSELDSVMRANGVWDILPEHVRQQASAREQYYAVLTQMAYAQARTNEEGARQFSDADFKNAMAQLAGNTSDPETFRKVIFGNVESNITNFISNLNGLPSSVPLSDIIGPAGMKELNDKFAEFETEFSGDWGSAAQPGEPLLPAEEGALDLGDGWSVTIQ